MKVALYTRISPNPTKDDTESQLLALREYCKVMKWEVVATYTDIHISGAKGRANRLEFDKMMLGASQRKFDVLLFWSLDRLTREGAFQTLTYLKQLSDYGVSYKSYSEQYLDTTGLFKDAIISILATIAQQERVRIGERTRAGLVVAKKKLEAMGRKLGRPKTRVDVSKLVEMRESGKSYREIAETYNYVDSKGKIRTISEPTVYRLLREYGKCSESTRS